MPRLPEQLETSRLRLRVPRVEDAPAVNAAILESLAQLRPWMPWAKTAPTIDETAEFCARSRREWQKDTAAAMLLGDKNDGRLLGSSGYVRLD